MKVLTPSDLIFYDCRKYTNIHYFPSFKTF